MARAGHEGDNNDGEVTSNRGRLIIAALVAFVVVGVSVRILTGNDNDQPNVATNTPVTAQTSTGPAPGSIDVVPHPLTITVEIEAPASAQEMQVSFDPTWQTAAWIPAAATADVGVSSFGYQILYTRFRDGSGISEVVPMGVEVVGADTDEFGVPKPRLGAASPTTIVVEISNGRLVRGPIGESDQLVGNLDDITPPLEGWTITADGADIAPISTRHITRPNGSGRADNGDILTATTHWVLLELPSPLVEGASYDVAAPSNYLRDDQILAPLAFDSTNVWSPNIHTNQVGYGPNDLRKVAMLTEPLGTTAPIADGWSPVFSLIDSDSTVVYTGNASPQLLGPDGELGRGDLTGTRVWKLDFSSVTTPGLYRLCVDGVGCSESFRVADDVWSSVAFSVARAMYHQRSGTALGAPYTSLERPETYTPAAGVDVFATGYSRLDGLYADPEAVFDGIIEQATTDPIEGAVGGHYDAGDWDRRIDHMAYVRAAIASYEVNPSFWEDSELNLPESGNAIPDILDEALWTLDFFTALQRQDGAVSGGVEATSHPIAGSVSWTEELDVYAFAPDPYSSYAYAGAAAEMATALRTFDQARSDALAESAERAMAWADTQPVPDDFQNQLTIQRGIAAVALYRHTGNDAYHQIFLDVSPFEKQGPLDFLECHGADTWCDGAWIYLRVTDHETSPTALENARQSFRNSADAVLGASNTTTFGWTIEDPRIPLIWGLGPGGAPKVTTLLRAHLVTDDPKYLEAAQQSAAFSLGMNPANQVYLTGIGRNGVTDPLIVDINQGALPVWPGTPVYGLHQLNGDYNWAEQYFIGPSGTTPAAYDSPFAWSYFDIHDLPFTSEFTVHQSHAPALFAYGTLAALADLG